ncbi:MAG: hypothetical protein IT384_00445, partial [Deltaproteobacteria bacterium]|nr:hypothetical protein [Deltaproteobacteria bacterium]
SCTDAATLERWLVGALHAKSVKSVLAPASPPRKPARSKARPKERT